MSLCWRREMVDRDHPKLTIARQCALLGVSRSGICYRPRGFSEDDLALMGEMDRKYLETHLLWVAPHVGLAGPAGGRGEPEAGAAADAHHGPKGHLPSASHQPQGAPASGLSLPLEERQDHPVQSGPAPDPDRGCGLRTSPTCPWPGASSTWWRRWTGTAGTWWLGNCPTRWSLAFAPKRCRSPCPRAGRRCSIPTRTCPGASRGRPDHQPGVHPDASVT